MGVSTLGLGTPITPFAAQQLYGQQSPFALASSMNPTAFQPLQQVHQLLQILPQQLQQLTHLAYLHQHQLQQLQQIVQYIPAQLQQLTQIIPQQIQQTQPFAQLGGAGLQGVSPWGVSPHLFGGQAGYVM